MALYNNLGFNIKETSDKNIEHFVEHKTLHIISYNIAVSCDTQSIFFLFKSDYLSSMGFFFFFPSISWNKSKQQAFIPR
jgi:hypothetical protein